ncbi:hypothetical protein D9758_006120 [Tetrapyrgos nigripes]|uniref:Uncharacterized protein n=1 Tax=Tetrapyrgos nigripes TaxID=182062 RepID=A0A8H5LL98_9AGAR|nr:hypothetical protein D9758_006120 [Tetrapyrgos nigripes]
MADILPTATPPSTRYSRFVVKSNDVLQGESRINVMKENSEEVIWFKERYLGEKEIVEHIVHNATRTICWTVHRPLRGWYIRLRAPTFPPGVFITFNPVPSRSSHYTEAALSFHSRTSLPCAPDESPVTTYFASPSPRPPPNRSSSSIHSYPPTPPAAPDLVLQPPSPTSASEDLPNTLPSSGPKKKLKTNPSNPSVSEFVLAPYADPVPSNSLFARVLNSFRDYDKMNYYSFTLSRIAIQAPPPYSSAPGSAGLGLGLGLASASQVPLTMTTSTEASISASSASPSNSSKTSSGDTAPASLPSAATPTSGLTSIKCLPLLTYHDHTSSLTFRSMTGLLEIDQAEEQLLGIDTSFWIAAALAYLDFLSDRGVSEVLLLLV